MMIGIFLEPNKTLNKIIIKWKLILKKNNINGKFINHPPHSTIYLANIKNQKKLFLIINKTVREFNKFKVIINKTGVFKNDLFAEGDTLYLNIKNNKNLFILQKKLADNLRSLVNKNSKNIKKYKFLNKFLITSQKKYGFPFVGNHWMPHFTIGSVKNYVDMKNYKKFKNLKINLENEVDKISVWKISGDKHIKLKEIKLSDNKKFNEKS